MWIYRRAGLPLLRWPARLQQQQQPWRALIALEWALLIAVALAFSPQTNTRHFLMLTLLAALAAVALVALRRKTAWRVVLAGTGLLYAGLTLPPGNYENAAMDLNKVAWQFIGGPSWLILVSAGLLLWGCLRYIRELAGGPATSGGRVPLPS